MLTTSYQDITMDTVDLANNTNVLERDATNTNRINIKETGYYSIYYSVPCRPTPSVTDIMTRVLKNNITELPGSYVLQNLYQNETHSQDREFFAYFTAGDYISLQARSGIVTVTTFAGHLFSVIKLDGVKGDTGSPGSGSTINVYNSGVNVSGSPFQILNFSGVTSSSSGISNAVDITNIYGSYFSQTSSEGESSTTSNTYQQKLRLTVSGLVAGTYRLGWYAETRCNSTNSDFEFRIQQDDSTVLAETNIESQDATTYLPQSGFVYVSLSAATTYNFDLDYSSETSGVTTYIRRARLEFWRVS